MPASASGERSGGEVNTARPHALSPLSAREQAKQNVYFDIATGADKRT